MLKFIFDKKTYKYVCSGIIGATINIGTLLLFTNIFHFWYLLSSVLAFTISCFAGFFLQKFWTFENPSKEHIKRQFAMYSTVLLLGNFINAILITFLVGYLEVHYVFAQCVSIFISALINFLIYDKLIFKNERFVE